MPITTDIDKIRLEIGDTDASDPLFYDDELRYFLDGRAGVILLAAADACEALARKFAREFDFTANGERSFKRSQKSAAYLKLAQELRLRASGTLGTVILTKADAFSDDLSTRDSAGPDRRTGRVRHGYYDEDLP